MNRIFPLVLVLSFVLAACGSGAAPASEPPPGELPSPPPEMTAPPTEVVVQEPTLAPTATATLEPTPTATRKPGPYEITIWYVYDSGSAEETVLANLLENAQTDLPDYRIHVLRIPFGQFNQQYQDEVRKGGGPDLLIAPNDNLGELVRNHQLMDITDLTAGRLDGYTQAAIEGMSLDGRLYGVPESFKAVAFWYNKNLLPSPPATTDELSALMESGKEVIVTYNCFYQYGFYSAFGGRIFDDNWKFIADQGGVADALTYLNGLYAISKKNNWYTSADSSVGQFVNAGAVATIDGNWNMGEFKRGLGERLSVAPLPAGPGGAAAPLLGVDGYYVNPNSPDPQGAVEVALYLTSKDAQTLAARKAGHVPVRSDSSVSDPLVLSLMEIFKNATVRPQVPQMSAYWTNFCSTNEIFEMGARPSDWVKQATSNANR